jgi:hypothetical protein
MKMPEEIEIHLDGLNDDISRKSDKKRKDSMDWVGDLSIESDSEEVPFEIFKFIMLSSGTKNKKYWEKFIEEDEIRALVRQWKNTLDTANKEKIMQDMKKTFPEFCERYERYGSESTDSSNSHFSLDELMSLYPQDSVLCHANWKEFKAKIRIWKKFSLREDIQDIEIKILKNEAYKDQEEMSLMLKEIFNYLARELTKDRHILEKHERFFNLDLKNSSEVLHWILFAFKGKRNKFRTVIRRNWNKYEDDIDELLEEIWKENNKYKRDEKLFDLIRTFCENIRIKQDDELDKLILKLCAFAYQALPIFNSIEDIRTFVFKYCAKEIGEKKKEAMTMWALFVQNCSAGTSQMNELVGFELNLSEKMKFRIFMEDFIKDLGSCFGIGCFTSG